MSGLQRAVIFQLGRGIAERVREDAAVSWLSATEEARSVLANFKLKALSLVPRRKTSQLPSLLQADPGGAASSSSGCCAARRHARSSRTNALR